MILAALIALGTLAVLASGAALCLVIALRRESRRTVTLVRRQAAQMEAAMRLQREALERDLRERVSAPPAEAPPVPVHSGINFTKRSQVLHLHRRGESAGQIASVLSLPRNEVELVLKVQEILLSNL